MSKSFLAKFFGWTQFVFAVGDRVLANQGVPHNWHDWLALAVSGAIALSVHHASNTDGQK